MRRSLRRSQRGGAWGNMSSGIFSLYPRCNEYKSLPPESTQDMPCSRLVRGGPDNCASGYRCKKYIAKKDNKDCRDYKCDLYDPGKAYYENPADSEAHRYAAQYYTPAPIPKGTGSASTGLNLGTSAAIYGASIANWGF